MGRIVVPREAKGQRPGAEESLEIPIVLDEHVQQSLKGVLAVVVLVVLVRGRNSVSWTIARPTMLTISQKRL